MFSGSGSAKALNKPTAFFSASDRDISLWIAEISITCCIRRWLGLKAAAADCGT